MHYSHRLLPLSLTLLLAACSSQPEPQPLPPEPVPQEKPQVIEIPQATGAIPRPEPMSTSGNRDYWIGKQKYEVWRDIKHYSEEGTASWLARDLDGNKTANGDVQDSTLFSAAHRNLPLPSYVRVTNLDNGLETIVRVNDRGPFGSDRLIDLSHAAARQLEMVDGGEARVRLELITDQPDQMVEMVPMTPMTPMVPAAPAADTFVNETPTATPPAKAAPAAAATATSTLSTPKAATVQGKMIQVLASGSETRAQAMGKVMTQRYGVPYQVVAHGAVFRVLLGPVATDQQAILLEQIRQGGLEQAFIVP
ncbi:septal ring lytic transglycosylase RlpA family protein [Aeromonas sanarellii]|uniref:septal ring lytic transglycosylase RlpA family protein n=1 Tax=Aeromonas sanarellii TaxID=633415 RepID=UPI0005A61F4C|nr:septal ring lytic transglycosylase RlpA family protein [Aeromonas sanarellii]